MQLALKLGIKHILHIYLIIRLIYFFLISPLCSGKDRKNLLPIGEDSLSSVSTFAWILFYCCKRNLFFKWSLTHQSPSEVLTFRGKKSFYLVTSFGPHILLVEKILFPLAFSYLKECTHKGPLAKLSLILTWLYFLSSLNVHPAISIQSNKTFWEGKITQNTPVFSQTLCKVSLHSACRIITFFLNCAKFHMILHNTCSFQYGILKMQNPHSLLENG